MAKVLVIAGTADAKAIIEELIKLNMDVTATVTTRLGSDLLKAVDKVDIREGKQGVQQIASLLEEIKPVCLIDASNPFAREIGQNARKACIRGNTPYIRFERTRPVYDEGNIIRVAGYEEAVEKLGLFDGNIMLTVGSGRIEAFTQVSDFKNRIYLRLLPDSKVITRCEKLGFSAKNIIAMKGPFTEELNRELLKYCNASVLVTKESGNTGGVMEKINAAKKQGIPVIMIEREEEEGIQKATSLREILDFVKSRIE